MRVEIIHASKYGNGEKVAGEFRDLMAAKGHEVNIHRFSDVGPRELPPADLYVFGSPTHFGKAVGGMIRFLKKADLPVGTRYAVFATFSGARPDKRTGRMPSEQELDSIRHTIPMMDEQLQTKGMRKVAEMKFFVDPESMKGPLEEGWQKRVEEFVAQILR